MICRFEATEPGDVARVVEHLDRHDVEILARTTYDATEAELPALAAGSATVVLSGWPQGIQRLGQALKLLSVPGGRVITKAYWASGKVGLD